LEVEFFAAWADWHLLTTIAIDVTAAAVVACHLG